MFIKCDIQRVLSEGIIKPSTSLWWIPVVVTKDDNHRKRHVIECSQTINEITQLDAYPVPNMDDFINKIAQYKVFTSADLKSAYHQIPVRAEERPYTAFEADGQLVQFNHTPFCITNGVGCFQGKMAQFILTYDSEDRFSFLDNVYTCGAGQEDHGRHWNKFRKAAREHTFTCNEENQFSLQLNCKTTIAWSTVFTIHN